MKYKCLDKLKPSKTKVKSVFISFINKILFCAIILLVCLILMKQNTEFKDFVNNKILNNNISFAYIKNLYNKYLGEVFPIDGGNVQEVFNEKIKYKSLEKYGNGYKLEVSNNYLVPFLLDGIIVYIGNRDEYGKVLIVENSDGSKILYGNINSSYKLYDYVKKGEFLGETINNQLYIELEKNGEYLSIENILSW